MAQQSDLPMTHEESLRIITSMIRSAQGAISHNAFDFLFWGWLLVAASVAHYVLLAVHAPFEPSLVYLVMPLGGVYMWWHHRGGEKHEPVQTHVDFLMPYVWGAFAAMMFLGIFYCNVINTSPMPWILLFVGTGTFITGGALKFRPLLLGGAMFWIASCVSFFSPMNGQIIVQAVAMILGYLIPGYMLLRANPRVNV